LLEFDISKVLGEHISRIVSPFDIENLYVLVSDSIAYKVVVDWNVFGAMFSNRVVSHENGTLVIATNGNGFKIIHTLVPQTFV